MVRSQGQPSSGDSFPPGFNEFAGGCYQLRRAAEIPVCPTDVHVPQVGRQHRHTPAYFSSTLIPTEERFDGEPVSEVVQPRPISHARFADTDLSRQLTEDATEVRFLQLRSM